MALNQSLRLVQRPRCRFGGVPFQPSERIHALVAIDQHIAIPTSDHHHRHQLSQLRHRGGQPPLLGRVADAKISVPQLDLMELQDHTRKLRRRRAPAYRVLALALGKSATSSRDSKNLSSYRVLRVAQQESQKSRNDYRLLC